MTKEVFVNAIDIAVGKTTVSDIKSVLKAPNSHTVRFNEDKGLYLHDIYKSE